MNTTLSQVFLLSAVVCCSCVCGYASEQRAAQLYREKCARCHGDQGQGVADGYQKPLRGTHTVAELATLVDETMPEEDPDECVGDEARLLAEYIHNQFYLADAAAAPRLTRLTVDQYRNAIADVIGSFKAHDPPGEMRDRWWRRTDTVSGPALPGLLGKYYQSRGMSKTDDLAQYRTDTRIDFDFGDGSPVETITPEQFSIVWEGGFRAGDTGYYEFRMSTPNGARLYLNLDPQPGRSMRRAQTGSNQQALIDAWVSSGKMRKHTARVDLLGGRTYNIRLEFFKYLSETSSIKLEWKSQHGAWRVLDYNDTITTSPPRVYVSETAFPADDRSLGYERGSSVSPGWQVATTTAAVEAATATVSRLPLLAGYGEDADTAARSEQIKAFVRRFAAVAFRRPLTRDEEDGLVRLALANPKDLEGGVQRAVIAVLMSPFFLYTDLTPDGEKPSPYTVAARLSLGIWDSIPDEELLDAAASGELESKEQLEAHARRMMDDPRAKAKMRSFFRSWLELDERDLAKDKQLFPDFDEGVIADLRRSLELFVERVVWSEESDYRQLLLADYLVLNERLGDLYPSRYVEEEENIGRAIKKRAAQITFGSSFQPIQYPAQERSGILTHPYLLSAYAYHNNTSPIHRGVFLTRNIVGRVLNPPPIAVAFKDDEFAPDLTMRQKITQLTRDSACMACHSVINPLGFTLENFDPVGRWRTTDNNKPVDTRSEYTTAGGDRVELASARDIAEFAVSSESAHRSFVTHVMQHVIKRGPADFATDIVGQQTREFRDDDFNVRNLWSRIAAFAAAENYVRNSASPDEVTP